MSLTKIQQTGAKVRAFIRNIYLNKPIETVDNSIDNRKQKFPRNCEYKVGRHGIQDVLASQWPWRRVKQELYTGTTNKIN